MLAMGTPARVREGGIWKGLGVQLTYSKAKEAEQSYWMRAQAPTKVALPRLLVHGALVIEKWTSCLEVGLRMSN